MPDLTYQKYGYSIKWSFQGELLEKTTIDWGVDGAKRCVMAALQEFTGITEDDALHYWNSKGEEKE